MVHVSPQCRQRQSALSVMNLARVSMILPLQNGQVAGRVTGPSPDRDSAMICSVAARSACFVCNAGQIEIRHPVTLVAEHGPSSRMSQRLAAVFERHQIDKSVERPTANKEPTYWWFGRAVRMRPTAQAIPEDPPANRLEMQGALSHGNQRTSHWRRDHS